LFYRKERKGRAKKTQRMVLGRFGSECPINFSLSRRHDKLKLIGHQTDPRLKGLWP
jgi:hypothetical protein